MPSGWEERLSTFQKLILVRCITPDKLVPAITDFCQSKMGVKFIEPPAFDLGASFSISTAVSPLVFILSPGVDPMAAYLFTLTLACRNSQKINPSQK